MASLDLAINMNTIAEAIYHKCILELQNCLNEDEIPFPLVLWNPPRVNVFTYGCPRIGNSTFLTLTKRYVKNIYRIAVNGDLITMLPKIPFFYRHVGIPILVDEEALGSITINPTIIESSFTRYSTGSINKHSLDVYRNCLEACFNPEELNEYFKKEFFTFSKSKNDNLPDWLDSLT